MVSGSIMILRRDVRSGGRILTVGEIVLIRHGETEWSASGQHTSYTDIDLTPNGEQQARGLAALLAGRTFAAVWCSPRLRARRTAALAGLAPSAERADGGRGPGEWGYGTYEGLTTAQIKAERPDWSLWTDGCPGGETPDEVSVRLDRVLTRARAKLSDGDVALIGHGHASGSPARAGSTCRWLWPAGSTSHREHQRARLRARRTGGQPVESHRRQRQGRMSTLSARRSFIAE
jgi:probable phosphoglycerate mutase